VVSPHCPHTGADQVPLTDGQTDRQSPALSLEPGATSRYEGTGEGECPPSTATQELRGRKVSQMSHSTLPHHLLTYTHLSKLSSPEKQREGSGSFTPSPQESLLGTVGCWAAPKQMQTPAWAFQKCKVVDEAKKLSTCRLDYFILSSQIESTRVLPSHSVATDVSTRGDVAQRLTLASPSLDSTATSTVKRLPAPSKEPLWSQV